MDQHLAGKVARRHRREHHQPRPGRDRRVARRRRRCRDHRPRHGQPTGSGRQASRGTGRDGRFTRPQEVADLVVLLASDRAGNITGSDITIDGGLNSTL